MTTRETAPWAVAGIATGALAVVHGAFGSVGVLMAPLAAALAVDPGALVLLFPAALAVHTLVARLAGRAADRFGPRPLLCAAAGGMAVGLLPAAAPTPLPVVVAGYGIGLGVASACAWVAAATAVGTAFRGRTPTAVGTAAGGRVATAMGVLTAGPAAGGAILAPTLSVVTQAAGVRPTCALLALLGVLACGAGALALPGHRPTPRQAARKAAHLRPVLVAAVLMGLVVFLPLVHLVATASRLGLSALDGAVVLATVSVVSAAARLAVGRLAAAVALPLLYRAAHLPVAVGFVGTAAAVAGGGPAFPLLLAAAGIFGAGYGAWLALGPALLAEACPPSELGSALGSLTAAVGIGGVAGPVLASLLTPTPAPWVAAAAIALLAALVLPSGTSRPPRRASRNNRSAHRVGPRPTP